MTNKKDELSLGEQFEEHQRQLEQAEQKGFNEGAAEQFEADHNPKFSQPHKVSAGMNELEAYRHLQRIEAEHALFQDVIRDLVKHSPSIGASNRTWYSEHGMLCDLPRKIGPCDCGWTEAEAAFARADKLLKELPKP